MHGADCSVRFLHFLAARPQGCRGCRRQRARRRWRTRGSSRQACCACCTLLAGHATHAAGPGNETSARALHPTPQCPGAQAAGPANCRHCLAVPAPTTSPGRCALWLALSPLLQAFHHALLEVHLEEGALICPEVGRRGGGLLGVCLLVCQDCLSNKRSTGKSAGGKGEGAARGKPSAVSGSSFKCPLLCMRGALEARAACRASCDPGCIAASTAVCADGAAVSCSPRDTKPAAARGRVMALSRRSAQPVPAQQRGRSSAQCFGVQDAA